MRLALPPALGTFTLKNVLMPSTPKKKARPDFRASFSDDDFELPDVP